MLYSDKLSQASRIQNEIEKLSYTKKHLHDNRRLEFRDVILFRGSAYEPSLKAHIPDIELEDHPEFVSLLEKIIQADIDEKTEQIEELLKK